MSTFFITRFDDAKRDGGRDGLGLLPIWSRLARQCIWNVTSISSDLAGWRSLLACAAITEQVVGDPSDQARYRAVMLATERLIALARARAPTVSLRSDQGLRGTAQVSGLTGKVRVDVEGSFKLLDAQASTGIVGQIGRPAIRSGLLTEKLTLTREAREHLALDENTLQDFNLRKVLIDGEEIDLNASPPLLDALARACGPQPSDDKEATWLRERVVWCEGGGDPNGAWRPAMQRCLAESLGVLGPDDALWLQPGALEQRLHGEARNAVIDWLGHVRALEALLGPMEHLFRYLRGACDKPIARIELVADIKKQWPVHNWSVGPGRAARPNAALDVLGALLGDVPQPFSDFAKALQDGEAEGCVYALLALNHRVAASRARSAWFTVHGAQIQAELPADVTSLQAWDHWAHSYYLKELRDLHRACAPVPSSGATP
jgi:hypothetical protein